MRLMDSTNGSGSSIPKLPEIVTGKKSTYDHHTPKPSIIVDDEDEPLGISKR
jgi:hypothetical protein